MSTSTHSPYPALFDPKRHEPLVAAAWNETAARAWIACYVDDAHDTFSAADLWPAHPLDLDGEDPGVAFTRIDCGAAGVIWSLDHLARAGAAAGAADFMPVIEELEARNTAQVEPKGHGIEGLLAGRSGILLLQHQLAMDRAASAADTDALAAGIAAAVANNAGHPSLELLWGSPGTMHVALTMHERTGEARWAELFRADADALWRTFLPADDAPCRLWTQPLWGRKQKMTGAGHGFAGNASALIRGRALLPEATWTQWADGIIETAYATALRDGPLANWPPETKPHGAPPKILVQWCHGAPGIVTSLAQLPDPRLDDLLAAAAELTWVAGPLEKGAGLCHGTAGNGYAFLKLFRRTHDERWLERARAFAMHAMAQSDRIAAEHGQRRHSLWTGDPGVACYAWSCITGDDALPNLDPAG
jgi:hypothetical protein